MINIAICDDNMSILTQIQDRIKGYHCNSDITIFHSGEELLKSIRTDCSYDIIFLDIEMPKINGIHTAIQLRKIKVESILIYVSSHKDFYYEAFETEPFRFINKPIDWVLFKNVFELAMERLTKLNNYFYFQKDKAIKRILLSQIMYFESKRRTINIVTRQETFCYYGKLDEVDNKIMENDIPFFRIHKSYIINVSYIAQLEFSKIHMVNGEVLPISENRRADTRRKFMKYIGGIMCGSE